MKNSKQGAIERATLDLVAEQGFLGTSVQLIADRADVGIGSIYRYFQSKDELIRAISEGIEARFNFALLDGYAEELLLKERFVQLGLNMVVYLMANPREFRFMEQYFSSPYFTKNSHDLSVGSSFGTKDSVAVFKALFEEGKALEIIKNLPLITLYALTFGSLVFLVNGSNAGHFELDEMTVHKTIEETWRAIAH